MVADVGRRIHENIRHVAGQIARWVGAQERYDQIWPFAGAPGAQGLPEILGMVGNADPGCNVE